MCLSGDLESCCKYEFSCIVSKNYGNFGTSCQGTAEWLDLAVEDTAMRRNPNGRQRDLQADIERIYSDTGVTPSYPPLSLLLRGIKNDSTEALSLLLGGKLSGGGQWRSTRNTT